MFILFFFVVLYASYFMCYGLPQTLLEFFYGSLAIACITILIVVVFIITSLVFGLPFHQIVKQLQQSNERF
jgi:hypothetical protein